MPSSLSYGFSPTFLTVSLGMYHQPCCKPPPLKPDEKQFPSKGLSEVPFLLSNYVRNCFRVFSYRIGVLRVTIWVSQQTNILPCHLDYISPSLVFWVFFFFFILHATFQDNQFYLFISLRVFVVFLLVYVELSKSHFSTDEILNMCKMWSICKMRSLYWAEREE